MDVGNDEVKSLNMVNYVNCHNIVAILCTQNQNINIERKPNCSKRSCNAIHHRDPHLNTIETFANSIKLMPSTTVDDAPNETGAGLEQRGTEHPNIVSRFESFVYY